MVIQKDKDLQLYQYVHDRNLLRQYDLLKDCVDIALKTPDADRVPTIDLLFNLNQCGVVNLCPQAGKFRPHNVKINNAPHQPPPYMEVGSLVHDFLQTLRRQWNRRDPLWLASYCLWRINWIHPFAEGNGRTARAVSYYVICVKNDLWLPGAKTIPHQIRQNRPPYYAALRAADNEAGDHGERSLAEMCSYLEGLLTAQLTDAV